MKVEWISVNDRLPDLRGKDDLPERKYWVLVDVYWTFTKVPEPAFCDENGIWWRWFSGCIVSTEKIKHWMPLPEPPTQ